MPEIRQFWLNAARVRTVRRGLSERFTMEGYRSGKSFRLLNRNVHEAAVWALEPRILGEEETERLRQEGRLREIRDGDGTLRETWIRWEETENFFVMDRRTGSVCWMPMRGSLPLERCPRSHSCSRDPGRDPGGVQHRRRKPMLPWTGPDQWTGAFSWICKQGLQSPAAVRRL